MKCIKIVTGLVLALGFATAHAIPVISVSADNSTTTSVAGTTTLNFNSGVCGNYYTSCVGDFLILGASIPGQSAKPVGTDGMYLSVPNPVRNGSATFTLGAAADYFGLYWGSIDAYNSISFYLGNVLVAGFGGADLPGLTANGNQVSISSNRYINFDFVNASYDSVKLTSNGFAFESDNHAYRLIAAVPEPATGVLMLLGLLGLFGARRRLR